MINGILRHTLALVAAIAAAGAMISGAILPLERSGKLQDEVQVLRVENAKLEALLDQALKTLHHERLMHFGEISGDEEGGTVVDEERGR